MAEVPPPPAAMTKETLQRPATTTLQTSSSSTSLTQNADDINDTETNPTPEPTFTISTRFLLAFASLAILTLMVALDGTSISVALPVIAKALNGTAIEAFWAGTSFLLAATVFQPNFASFSHIFGRMPVIMVSLGFFFAGVMIAALAKDFGMLLAGRTIQGIGGGGESFFSLHFLFFASLTEFFGDLHTNILLL